MNVNHLLLQWITVVSDMDNLGSVGLLNLCHRRNSTNDVGWDIDTWSEEEDKILIHAHIEIGNNWAEIAKRKNRKLHQKSLECNQKKTIFVPSILKAPSCRNTSRA
ncbi:hypothetical protein GQ457_15G000730 [Hibiscus cannabinus]